MMFRDPDEPIQVEVTLFTTNKLEIDLPRAPGMVIVGTAFGFGIGMGLLVVVMAIRLLGSV